MKTTMTILLSIVLISISIVCWKMQDRKESQLNNVKTVVLKDTVDIWSDTLLYWANTSTTALQQSWECVDKDEQDKCRELYDRNDSIYYKLLDDCEKRVTQNKFSKIVEKVVTNQIQL